MLRHQEQLYALRLTLPLRNKPHDMQVVSSAGYTVALEAVFLHRSLGKTVYFSFLFFLLRVAAFLLGLTQASKIIRRAIQALSRPAVCFGKSIFQPLPHPSSFQGKLSSCIETSVTTSSDMPRLMQRQQIMPKPTPLNMLNESSHGVP